MCCDCVLWVGLRFVTVVFPIQTHFFVEKEDFFTLILTALKIMLLIVETKHFVLNI